jgi:flagellar capping protein FliD
MIVDTGSFDLGLTQIDKGNDARVFYGSTDPAQGVLLTSSRNTLDSVLTGVTIDLKTVSQNPVTLTIARNNEGIETAVTTFVDAFNSLIDRIATQTRYDASPRPRAAARRLHGPHAPRQSFRQDPGPGHRHHEHLRPARRMSASRSGPAASSP